jgi:hypothetical protein
MEDNKLLIKDGLSISCSSLLSAPLNLLYLPVMSSAVLSCDVMSCSVMSSPVLSYPILSYPALNIKNKKTLTALYLVFSNSDSDMN